MPRANSVNDIDGSPRFQKEIPVEGRISHRLEEVMSQHAVMMSGKLGWDSSKSIDEHEKYYRLPITAIVQSSHVHVDEVHKHMRGQVSSAISGLVFLEDTTEGYFEYDGEIVPVRQGTLVAFDATVSHRTYVPSGSHVFMLGPFVSYFSRTEGRRSLASGGRICMLAVVGFIPMGEGRNTSSLVYHQSNDTGT